MPAYLITDETITDPEVFDECKRGVLPLITKYGGRFLSRGAKPDVLEAGKEWPPWLMVVIEFPSMTALRDWSHCDEYAPVRDIRRRSAKSTLVAVDSGIAGPSS